MEIQSLQDLEAAGAHAKIERLLDTTLPASRDPQLWKYASTYYVRRGMAGKSLEYYSGYLQSSTADNRDGEAVSLAIECAHRLGRATLVRDYFMALTAPEREKLGEQTLTQVSSALVKLGLADEAERVVKFLRQRSGAQQLPDFDSLITEKFGNRRSVLDFIARTPETPAATDQHANIRHAMDLALAHISQGNYTQAEKILVGCRARIAA